VAEVLIRGLQPGDTEALLADLRPADAEECDALLGPGKQVQALTASIDQSVACWVLTVNGGVAAIFGVGMASLLDEHGLPWMLGTSLIDRFPGAFIRQCRPYIARMLAVCPSLVNVVDARNTRSIAWLKRMGFTILPAQPMGAAGLPFHPFFMTA
jgi:hypothetical protein